MRPTRRPGAARPLLAMALLAAGCLPDPPATDLTQFELTLGPDSPYAELASGEAGSAQAWDVRLDGWSLFLNGGESGSGLSGGIDVDLLDLELQYEDLSRRNQLLYFFFFDSYGCPLSDWWWYGLDGTHTLFSNYHVYIVEQGERRWAWQMLDYYTVLDGASVAGYPRFRWLELDTPGAELHELAVDATAGGLGADPDDPENRWTYVALDQPDAPLDLSDEEAAQDATWQLGFKRFNVKSNSGPSGPGGVVSLDWDAQRGETAEQVLAFEATAELPRFEQRAAAYDGSGTFVEDSVRPVVDRWAVAEGADAELDPDKWYLVGDRAGDLLAKLRVVDLVPGADGPESLTLQWALLE